MESSVGLDRDSLHEAAHQTAEDIYSHARACEFLFTEYLQPSESLRIYHNKVHEYERRFLLWASFLGVFASEGTSLDERLQYAPETKELVLSMLQVLRRNLKRGIIRHLINPAMGPSIEVPKSDGILYGITGSIDRLHRLAIAMQYPPRTDKVDRVRNFASKQAPDDFYDLILTRLEYVFPSAEKTLRAELAESIVYRRHRLLWTRRSSTMLAHQRVEKTENRPVEKEQEKASRSSKFGDDPHAGSTQQDSISGASNRGVLSSGQPSQLLQRADENSYHDQIVGQEDNHSSCSSNSLPKARYPDPPLAGGDEERLVCEYCLQEIQLPLGGTDKARNAVWRAHIDKDLRPYVCISEQCRGFPVDFFNVKEWKAHMQNAHHADWIQFVHRVTWQCPHCNDNFMTKELLHNHLTENHQKHYATSPDPLELAEDIIRSETTRFRAADECPLCGPPPWNEQDSQQKDGPSGTLPNDLQGHFLDLTLRKTIRKALTMLAT
ncbi:putative serine threonine protein kinase [Rosellinia necatrix]|uniref:Putative serine threonine protein kinase n=1 Tax=Rosellinia necatrix TaxID=77044 RepID=A0A1S7UNI4_ROSNE|nr:putative serine threonine protein kinase [Rosellinia necatrix]